MIQRYEARTWGGMNDYSLEREEDGPLCRAYDVEKLEVVVRRLEKQCVILWRAVEQARNSLGTKLNVEIEALAKEADRG